MGKATLIYRLNETRLDGIKVDMVIWQLPVPTQDRPHGLKYRLWAGRDGKTLVRYDNEKGKGDHKHAGEAGVGSLPLRVVIAIGGRLLRGH